MSICFIVSFVILLFLFVFIYFLFLLFFFFFKQKTAYEMRISDWSSDVCSSDLLHGRGADFFGHFRGEQLGLGRFRQAWFTGAAQEIGRASCRERVCQYV